MSRFILMFADEAEHWLIIDEEAITRRGTGFDSIGTEDNATRIYVLTSEQSILQRLDLPDLTPVQASAAARLQLSGQTLLAADDLHITCARDGEIGYHVVSASRILIQHIIEQYDPDIILPSPLILPDTDHGFIKAALPGETVIRGNGLGFSDDPVITPLLVGEQSVNCLEGASLEAALIAAVAKPVLNLRSGELARRVLWRFDDGWRRKMLLGTGLLLLLTLAVPLVEIIRLSMASQTLEQTSISLAQGALGEAVAPESAVESLDAELSSLRGGGAGFMKTTSAALKAVESTANVEVASLAFGRDGTLRLVLRGAAAPELETVQSRMRAAGLDVRAGSVNPSQGQPILDVQVRGR